jgi:hypothetical protein
MTPLCIGGIGTKVGLLGSHGGPMYLLKLTTTNVGSCGGLWFSL